MVNPGSFNPGAGEDWIARRFGTLERDLRDLKGRGKVDGVRYDLLPVTLLDVVRDQENRLRALEGRAPLPARGVSPNVPSAGAPEVQPEPLPYAIQSAA